MNRVGAAVVALMVTSTVSADEIHLVGGGKISGEIVERNAQRVVVETGPGRVTLPMSRVTKIDAGTSALAEFQDRARALQPGDAASWLALGQWAADHDLATQARTAYQRALALDPTNADANARLGRVERNGLWLSEEEAYRAQGLVPFEGAWVTPGEREAARRDRSDAELAKQAERESEARVREAEARARAAEAEARRVEAEAASSDEYSGDGIPFWPYAYGGGGGGPRRPHRDPSWGQPDHEPRPTPVPPAPKPPTSSLNGRSESGSGSTTPPKAAPARKH